MSILDRVGRERIDRGMWWDRAWSLVSGCSPCSDGCDHCWAASEAWMRGHQKKSEKMRDRYNGLAVQSLEGPRFNGKIRLNIPDLDKPLKVKTSQVWAVWNDLYHPRVGWQFVDKAFEVIEKTPHHFYMILTKRPANLAAWYHSRKPKADNVAFGYTVCGPSDLLGCQYMVSLDRDALLFLSVEPLIKPVSFRAVFDKPIELDMSRRASFEGLSRFALVIVGGESGKYARPTHPQWIWNIKVECDQAGVPFFFKRWGAFKDMTGQQLGICNTDGHPKYDYDIIGIDGEILGTGDAKNKQFITCDGHWEKNGGAWMARVGEKNAGRELHGQVWNALDEPNR